jgi:uncharacterized protein (DUF1778 family)
MHLLYTLRIAKGDPMAAKNRTELLVVRLKPEEKERVIHAADAHDLRLSDYIRGAIAAALKSDRGVNLT